VVTYVEDDALENIDLLLDIVILQVGKRRHRDDHALPKHGKLRKGLGPSVAAQRIIAVRPFSKGHFEKI
jgi:hypothetical protein